MEAYTHAPSKNQTTLIQFVASHFDYVTKQAIFRSFRVTNVIVGGKRLLKIILAIVRVALFSHLWQVRLYVIS